jgi:DNA relaxase NicK
VINKEYPITVFEINPEGWACSVDFLRFTREKRLPKGAFFTPVSHATAKEIELGYTKQPFRLHDIVGAQIGHVGWGQNDERYLIEFRGDAAHDWYQHYIGWEVSVSRIDLAVTVWFEDHTPELASIMYAAAREYWREIGKNQGYKYPTLIDSEGGCTLYLGSRTSQRYFRLYDKWAQSEDPRFMFAWRFEIELKGELARVIWQDIGNGVDIYDIALHEVFGTMERYGIRPSDFEDYGKLRKIPRHGSPPDILTKLEWLQKQVRPSVEKLKDRGYEAAVRTILGLHDE